MKRYLPVVVLPLMLGACDTLSLLEGDLSLLEDAADTAKTVEDHTLGNAMKALPKYCKLPQQARQVFRKRVTQRPEAQGNQIGIWCQGDPVLTLGQ